jgi:hypothetical protein
LYLRSQTPQSKFMKIGLWNLYEVCLIDFDAVRTNWSEVVSMTGIIFFTMKHVGFNFILLMDV